MASASAAVLPGVLRWFGPDSVRAALLHEHAVAHATGSALRARYLERIAPLLAELGDESTALLAAAPDFAGFDEARRRTDPSGPDAATIARVRGDKNRAFLVD
jgi:hypothetical protein